MQPVQQRMVEDLKIRISASGPSSCRWWSGSRRLPEVQRLLTCASPLKHRVVLATLYAAGLRLEEGLHRGGGGPADSCHFSVDRITRDQAADYARRMAMPLAEVEQWLSPNLGYEPGG